MTQGAANWFSFFPGEEIPFILAAVLRCGDRLSKRDATELENNLTDRLRDELDRDPTLKARPVELFREVPLYDRKRARQRPLGRSDLLFLFSTGTRHPWPYFVLESKRLNVTFPSGWKSLVSEYVTGDQGMMCFINERYAADLDSGGMLGYVFDTDVSGARVAISNLIVKNRVILRAQSPSQLVPSSIISGENRIHETTHSLSRGAFTIYHLFIPV